MILSQPELRVAVQQKAIVFSPPLEERQWGEASIDLRLGYEFTIFREDIDTQGLSLSIAKGLQLVGV
jgi:deoxycytidine triphosphate deaminase